LHTREEECLPASAHAVAQTLEKEKNKNRERARARQGVRVARVIEQHSPPHALSLSRSLSLSLSLSLSGTRCIFNTLSRSLAAFHSRSLTCSLSRARAPILAHSFALTLDCRTHCLSHAHSFARLRLRLLCLLLSLVGNFSILRNAVHIYTHSQK